LENQRTEKLLKLLEALALGDAAVYSHPAATPEHIQKIFDVYSIPTQKISDDPIEDLFLGLRTVLADVFIDNFNLQKKSPPVFLRGVVVLYWKYFSLIKIPKIPDIMLACQEPDAVESFDSFLGELPWVRPFSHSDLSRWFEESFYSVPSSPKEFNSARRKLGKHEIAALEILSSALYQIIPSAFIDPQPETVSSGTKEIPLELGLELLRVLMRKNWSFATSALGISVPINDRDDRNVQMGSSEILHTAVDNLIPYLLGSSGIISSRPFSGLSTFLRSLALTWDEPSKDGVCYIDAESFYRYVTARRSLYAYLADQMVTAGLIESEQRETVSQQIEQVISHGHVIIFVDNLHKLSETKVVETIQFLSFVPQVYYAVRTSEIPLITGELTKFSPALVSLKLLDLDCHQQDVILLKILQALNRTDAFDDMNKKLLELRRDPGEHDILTSPLGILALATQTGSLKTMRTRIIFSVLDEILAREGFGSFTLKPTVADKVSLNLLLFAGWVSSFASNSLRLSSGERAHLAWRLMQDEYKIFDENGYLPLLGSALFSQDVFKEEFGFAHSYWFAFRDIALFFIAANTYDRSRWQYNDPYNNLWYVNNADKRLEAEVLPYLADLKEFIFRGL